MEMATVSKPSAYDSKLSFILSFTLKSSSFLYITFYFISHNLRKAFTSQAISMISTFYNLKQAWYLTSLYLAFATLWVIMRALPYLYRFWCLFIYCWGGKLSVLKRISYVFLLRLIYLVFDFTFVLSLYF